jgi:hypothetical protein
MAAHPSAQQAINLLAADMWTGGSACAHHVRSQNGTNADEHHRP